MPEIAYLHDLAGRLPGPAPLFDLVQDHQPVSAIADYAGDRDDTIVVVRTHGRSGLRNLVMGSVAHGVAHEASCPVLVVPPRASHQVA